MTLLAGWALVAVTRNWMTGGDGRFCLYYRLKISVAYMVRSMRALKSPPPLPPFKPVVPEVTAASQRSRVPVLRNAVTSAAPSSRLVVDVLVLLFLQSA